MLLDEPAAGITGAETEQLVRIIRADQPDRDASSSSITTCSSCACSAASVTVFHQGAILREGPADEVLADATRARGLHREPRAMSDRCTDIDRRSPTTPAPSTPRSDVVLDVADLRAGYGHVPVLHGVVARSCDEGEALGIVGHNGMGKTTLLKALIGLLPATAGRIAIDGVDVTRDAGARRAAASASATCRRGAASCPA